MSRMAEAVETAKTAKAGKQGSARRRGRIPFLATVTLAGWRLRQTWRLLLISGLGIVAAVVLVCAVPLFSQVAMSAGLRQALTSDPQASQLDVGSDVGSATGVNPNDLAAIIDRTVRQDMGRYITRPAIFSASVQMDLPILGPDGATLAGLRLQGVAPADASTVAKVIQGRLPNPNAAALEIALPPDASSALNAPVGATLKLGAPQFGPPGSGPAGTVLAAKVVGIVAALQQNNTGPGPQFGGSGQGQFGNSYVALTANDLVLNVVAPAIQAAVPSGGDKGFYGPPVMHLDWTYTVDVARVTINNFDDLSNRAHRVQVDVSNAVNGGGGPYGAYIYGGVTNTLDSYRTRVLLAQIPVVLLLLQVLGLVLLFVSVMVNLLVERQVEAIAVLRSRGASRGVIFRSMTLQSLGVGLLALLGGPLLALLLVSLVAGRALAGKDQGAVQALLADPLAAAWGLRWYALLAAVAAVIAMIFSTRKAASLNVLALRRESARARGKPLWQRLNLDLIFAVIAVTGYVLYTLAVSNVDPRVRVFLSPLALIAPIFLLLAISLVFLRFYPLLLRLGAWLAAKRRKAPAMLALAQMARSPRQASRMTLLLALATAFAIFTLIFTASQYQRTLDVAAFQAGADFAGNLPATTNATTPAEIEARYTAVAGVTAASAGQILVTDPPSNAANAEVHLLAVNADTFAQAALWPDQDTPPLPALMDRLVSARAGAASSDAVPAVVDGALAELFHVQRGSVFSVTLPGYEGAGMRFQVVAVVNYIPTIFDSREFAFQGGPVGLLVDYQSFATVYRHDVPDATAAPNHIWLASHDDAASLASVRAALAKGNLTLESVQDRRALVEALRTDPLQIDLLGALGIGAATALVLALLGLLIASWLSARTRLTSFALLRALGTEPRQLGGVLIWEQGIVYGLALALGVVVGMILSTVVLPVLVFANITAINNPNSVNTPPVQVVLPWTGLGIALAAVVLLCAVSIALMAGVVARASIGQALRLNED
ncbi:MAG TPA: ABC transporter permease [Ktedonobacterales bacterium]|nr:ABC transporter permease [Ktedonobacterales bacterium]